MSILSIDLHSSKSTIRLSFHFQNVTLMNHLTTYMLCRRIQAREPHVQNIRQLEAALHREWQQLSQQDIRRLTGGMRCRVEAVIHARGGYTRYWTLNNRCRQVIHKWRFERHNFGLATRNRDMCHQTQLWFSHWKQGYVSRNTTLV